MIRVCSRIDMKCYEIELKEMFIYPKQKYKKMVYSLKVAHFQVKENLNIQDVISLLLYLIFISILKSLSLEHVSLKQMFTEIRSKRSFH